MIKNIAYIRMLSVPLIVLAWLIAVWFWNAVITLTTKELQIWQGIDDEYLNRFRTSIIFCWRIVESPYLVVGIGLIMGLIMASAFIISKDDGIPKIFLCVLLITIVCFASVSMDLFMGPLGR